MSALASFVRAVDAINGVIGRCVAWLVLGVVLVCFAVVVARYGFNWGDVRLQEAYVWMHAIVFLVGAGYTLRENEHVRVDLVYANLKTRTKAWIDLLGTVFWLMPWMAVLVYFGWPFVASSWAVYEPSMEQGGLPGYFLLKSVIFVFVGVVSLQALALIARCLLVLSGEEQWATKSGTH
ncbi:TRAP transporter small permease subunit [Insolitispirillum peregrinum]|uniref:TRAP transporter small permease subunit n=1 Tax=Insolitispirillum peregrinum TaxID=80876 RepID=UPI00360CB27E